MRLKTFLIGFLLLCLLASNVLAVGEGTVKKYSANGTEIPVVGVSTGGGAGGEKKAEETKTTSSDIDVWGIQSSNMKASDYVNFDVLMGIASGIIPLRNLSLLSISVAFLIALTSLIVGILVLVAMAGYGGLHPNVKKSLEIITSSRNKIIALGSVFFLALFMITMTFFFLAVFSKLNWFVA